MEAKKYDLLIVGTGLYGAMAAYSAMKEGKRVLMLDRRKHIGGYCYTEKQHGIEVHLYGAHIFRTNNRKVWDFVNTVTPFRPFVNSPIARVGDKVYNLPFNMNTFNHLWGCTTPEEAERKIASERIPCDNPANLEEFVLSVVGREVYETFIKGYTEKQWGRPCSELPVSTMSRIPIRLTFDNNYYNEIYQGIPIEGYTRFIEELIKGADVCLDVDYLKDRSKWDAMADEVLFTGPIDEFYGYSEGRLEYRSVRFEHVYHPDNKNVQGNAVVNYPTWAEPYTRSIEHRHFMPTEAPGSIVTFEYPVDENDKDADPSYPVLNSQNKSIYERYRLLAEKEPKVKFGGRLGEYRYYAMNDIVEKFI